MMIIDDREPDWAKNHQWEFPTRVERSKVGDYIMTGGIVIEAKEINDFVGSMQQRLWEQATDLEGLIEDDESGIHGVGVIIYGSVRDLNSHNMEGRKIKGIYGALARLIASYGVGTAWVHERSQFIKLLGSLHDKAGTETSAKKPHLTKRRFRDNRINVLYGIDGIGYDTASNLLGDDSPFSSLAEIAQADSKQLTKVAGVGAKTAERIIETFHEGEKRGGLL